MMEEPKQDHHNDAASKPPYSWRVLIIYSLFGPPLGAVLLLLGSGLTDPNPEQAFRLIPIAIIFSYPVGGLPAFLTGLWAMLLHLKRNLARHCRHDGCGSAAVGHLVVAHGYVQRIRLCCLRRGGSFCVISIPAQAVKINFQVAFCRPHKAT